LISIHGSVTSALSGHLGRKGLDVERAQPALIGRSGYERSLYRFM
jgi:hypothetical protein